MTMAPRQSQHEGVRRWLYGFEADPNDVSASAPRSTTSVIPYVPSTIQGAQEFTPMVDVSLIGAYAAMEPKPALVDSGAERTAIPKAWAPLLGIDLADCREIRVHSGAVTGRGWVPPHPVEAIIAGCRVQLSPIFSDTRADLGLILGRDAFLHFDVEFDERARELRLTPYPERVGLKERSWD